MRCLRPALNPCMPGLHGCVSPNNNYNNNRAPRETSASPPTTAALYCRLDIEAGRLQRTASTRLLHWDRRARTVHGLKLKPAGGTCTKQRYTQDTAYGVQRALQPRVCIPSLLQASCDSTTSMSLMSQLSRTWWGATRTRRANGGCPRRHPAPWPHVKRPSGICRRQKQVALRVCRDPLLVTPSPCTYIPQQGQGMRLRPSRAACTPH